MAQNEYDYHILNDPLYRDIVKHHLKVSDQNIDDAIVIDKFLITLQKAKGSSLKLSTYTSIDLPSTSPEELIRQYSYKISELEAVCNNISTEIEMRLEKDIENITELIERELKKHNVKASTGNKYADMLVKETGKETAKQLLIKKKEKQIEEARREAEQKLKLELESKLRPVRDQMLSENKEGRDKSLYAAAYAPEESDENNHIKEYYFYKCCYDYVKSNYSYLNTRWLNPPCANSANWDYQSSSMNEDDYAKIAIRKYDLYKEYKNKNFLDATLIYLNQGLADNPRNADLFVLKYKLEDDIIEKYHAIKIANHLAKNNLDIEYKYENYEKTFIKELKSSIDNKDVNFINECFEKNLASNIRIDNIRPLEYCIKTDNADMMDLYIKQYDLTKKELNYLQVPIVMFDAKQCLGFLNKNYNIDNNLLIREKNNLTLLNIALLNEKEVIARTIVSDKNAISSLAYASRYLTQKELDNLCDFLYENNNSYLSEIKRYNSTFNPTAYKIKIKVHNCETAEIYYNKQKIGSGSAIVGIRKLDQLGDIQVFGENKFTEELKASYLNNYLNKGNNNIEISIVNQPNRLLNIDNNFQGKRNWNEFYYTPNLLPETKTKIKKPFATFAAVTLMGNLVYSIVNLIAYINVESKDPGNPPEFGFKEKYSTVSFITGALPIVLFANVAAKKSYKMVDVTIQENIDINKKTRKNIEELARVDAYNYNRPLLQDKNKLISEKNERLLSEREIILIDKNGEQKEITPAIDNSFFVIEESNDHVTVKRKPIEKNSESNIENETKRESNYSNYPSLILFKGIDNITTGTSTYNQIIKEFGLPYAVENSSDNNKHVIYKDIGVDFIFMNNSRRLSYVSIEETFKGISKEGIKIGMSKARIQEVMEMNKYIKSGKNVAFYEDWKNAEGKQVSFWWNSDNTLKKIIIY